MGKRHSLPELIEIENIEGSSNSNLLLSGAALSIDESLCLNLRSRTLSCKACANVCVSKALELSENAVALDADNCTGCGACLSSCPSGVFSLSSFSPSYFLDELKGREKVNIHCSVTTDKSEGLNVPCLRLLDARLVATAFAAGTKFFHLSGLSDCEQCDKGSSINHMVATQNRLMQWFGIDSVPQVFVETVPLVEWVEDYRQREEQPKMSRRQFFHRAGLQAVAATSLCSMPSEEDAMSVASQGFDQINIDHQRPVEYQSLLTEQVTRLPWVLNEIPWYGRTINNKCNACLACGQRCPTGALQAEQTDAGCGINFKAGLCTDCGLCAQVCPMDAIQRYRVKDVDEVVAPRSALMYRHYSTCQHCAQTFLPQTAKEELCSVCKNEQVLESEWLTQLRH